MELKRTLTKSKIKVISAKVLNMSDQSLLPFQSACDYFDGWVDNNSVEWMEVIDGREEIIDSILKDIEQDIEQNEEESI